MPIPVGWVICACHPPPEAPQWIIYYTTVVNFVCNGSDSKVSLICMKWVKSLSSFVNKSDTLCFPMMCCTLMTPSWTAFRIAFSQIWRWQRPFLVRECDHIMHAALSLYTVFSFGIRCVMPMSVRMLCRYMRYLVHSSVVYISASAELCAVIDCRLDCQWFGPLSQMMNPESDHDLKSCNGGSFGLGFDLSCGPQLASVNGVIVWVWRGNFMNASIFGFTVLWNAIPRVLVPFRWCVSRRRCVCALLCGYILIGGWLLWQYLALLMLLATGGCQCMIEGHCLVLLFGLDLWIRDPVVFCR